MRNPYFGEAWDAPAVEDAVQVATPVGVPCLWCGVEVAEGDQGFMVNAVRRGQDGELCAELLPQHRECQLRAVVGSPAHLDGECFCNTGKPETREQTPQERRAEAIEVWNRVLASDFGRRADPTALL